MDWRFDGLAARVSIAHVCQSRIYAAGSTADCDAQSREVFGKVGFVGHNRERKFADLVLLEANPLEDIGNTRRINTVVENGRYLAKETLQKMLTGAEVNASKR
ncbi:MAG TPA: hypothetical protein VJU86_06270 [Pyrinomonadaceae bacterium]|nr:hypothetical protein [Pyrinomonadaceae bacterium]